MAIPYTQDWSAGNSTFSSMNVYTRATNGPDALYPDINFAEGVTVSGGKLTWNGVYSDYQSLSMWFKSMGSLNGGGAGGYAVTGFWDATVGYVDVTYLPNATSLGDISYAPLIWLLSPSSGSLLGVYWDAVAVNYEIERNTEDGYQMTQFAGEAPADGVPLTIRLSWRCGTYQVGPAEHDPDGYLRVSINGVLAYEETAIPLYLTFDSSPVDLLDGVAFGYQGLLGSIDDITISDVSPDSVGSLAWGSKVTTAAPRAVAFGMDGVTHTHSESGKVKFYGNLSMTGYLEITDGIDEPDTASGAAAGMARIFIDNADGDLKIKYADGMLKTIVVDT